MQNFPLKYLTSKKEYKCDGCAGEFLIPQNTMYARMAYHRKDGKLGTMKLCMRCICAIQNKLVHSPGFAVEPGCLRLGLLSAKFRKTWAAYFRRIMELDGSPEGDGLAEKLLAELGIGMIGRQEAEKMNEQRHEQRKIRMIHREKRQLLELTRKTDAMRRSLCQMLDNLAMLHLKETMAWTNGNKPDIDKAKTEYGEYVKLIRTAIDEWTLPKKQTKEN